MANKRTSVKPRPAPAPTAFEKAWSGLQAPAAPPPTVPIGWLLKAAALALVAAAICAWGALCLLFWQGSWQLLYHPSALLARTPANRALAYETVTFATTEAGQPQLSGWWIPADAGANHSEFTLLYLHGQNGNLGDSVDTLATLHGLGLNILAFDYRGYGQSQFARPSEAHWREDADSALKYLTGTRHLADHAIVVAGQDLGANLALETAAQHSELAGVMLESPAEDATSPIFNDARSRLVPAHWLVRDRFDLSGPASALRMPSLWIFEAGLNGAPGTPRPAAYDALHGAKTAVWFSGGVGGDAHARDALARWIDDLPAR